MGYTLFRYGIGQGEKLAHFVLPIATRTYAKWVDAASARTWASSEHGADAWNTRLDNPAKRIIVDAKLYDDFLEKFTAKVLAAADDISPLSSEAAAQNLARQVDAAVAAGAKLATKGERKGAHFPPGVLTGVTKDSPTYREELFGPVAQVYKVHSEDEAIELANDIPFGLGSYLFTTDPEQADRVAERIEAGMVFVNVVEADGVELPFGGVKRSGFGRELGRFGIDEFVNKKLIRKG